MPYFLVFEGLGPAIELIGYAVTAVAVPFGLLDCYGVLENFGYRQLATWWRLAGIRDHIQGKRGWGTMTRKGFNT